VVLANAAKKIRNILASSPRPNHIIEIGIQAIGGIGRINRKMGLKIALARRYLPISRPSMTPARDPRQKPMSTLLKLLSI
jgi:hypothetical protein